MKAKIKRGTDGRVLVSVRFKLASPNEDDEDTGIEAMFAAYWATDYSRSSNPIGLILLSVTRTDTREDIGPLAPGWIEEVVAEAALAVDDYDASLTTS
jgi:hypothetical protein